MLIKRILRWAMALLSSWTGRLKLRAVRISAPSSTRISGRIVVNRDPFAQIIFGENIVLNSRATLNSLEARGPVILKANRPHAIIAIGADTGITSATISAMSRVEIGERVLIGAGVLITDSDHHVVRPPSRTPRRHLGIPEPVESDRVVIADDVFVGARSMILKGVTVGVGAVVGAGSVVSSDVPPGSIVAGNPARVVGSVSPITQR